MPRTKPPTPAKISMSKAQAQPSENLVDIQAIQLPQRQQPRRYFEPEKMKQLRASVEEHGILEPLIVRPLENGQYELVAGERRLRTAQELGLAEVPVVVRDFSDQKAYEVSLLENLQRDDLNAIDETEGILHLLCQALDYSKEDVISLLNLATNAQRRGVTLSDDKLHRINLVDQLFLKVGRLNRESFRTNRLPLLNLPEDVLQVLRQGKIEYTKAKEISKLEQMKQRKELMQEAITNSWSLIQIKTRIKELQKTSSENAEIPIGKQLQASLSTLSKTKAEVWNDKEKQKSIAKIIAQLEQILQN
jgi:ParB family transcriptional regulator, chromosome partitioning protein